MSESGENIEKDFNAFARVISRIKSAIEWVQKNALILFLVGLSTGGAGGSSCSNLMNRTSRATMEESRQTNHRVDSALTLLTNLDRKITTVLTAMVALKGGIERMPGGKNALRKFEKDRKKAIEDFGLSVTSTRGTP